MPLVSREAEQAPTVAAPRRTANHGGAGGADVVPVQSRAQLPTSWEVADFPVPHGREENWRFTPVRKLAALFADQPATGEVSWTLSVPEPATLSAISADEARRSGAPAPADRAAVVAAAGADGARHIDIPAETELDEPIRVDLVGDDAADQARDHLVITAGRYAKATVVLAHTGSASYGQLISMIAGDGAQLTLISVQDWESDAIHLAQHDVVVGRDATVTHIAVSLGGSIVRVATNASYAGPGGTFNGVGIYFVNADQHIEHRLFVDHEPPHCTSDVVYRGALQGESAHAVWVGDVLIQAAAEGTQTYEINRNLLLTQGARADSVPNLEIETGEILGAGHASTTGRFDDEQLFYLMSRGLPQDEARRLVVHAFFAELVDRIDVPDLAQDVMSALDAELSASLAEDATDEGDGA